MREGRVGPASGQDCLRPCCFRSGTAPCTPPSLPREKEKEREREREGEKERERNREREKESERESETKGERECVRERECVYDREKENERERAGDRRGGDLEPRNEKDRSVLSLLARRRLLRHPRVAHLFHLQGGGNLF